MGDVGGVGEFKRQVSQNAAAIGARSIEFIGRHSCVLPAIAVIATAAIGYVGYRCLSKRQVVKTDQITKTNPKEKKKKNNRTKSKILTTRTDSSAHQSSITTKAKIKPRHNDSNRGTENFIPQMLPSDEKISKIPAKKIEIILNDTNGTKIAIGGTHADTWQKATPKVKKALEENLETFFKESTPHAGEKTFQLQDNCSATINFRSKDKGYTISGLCIEQKRHPMSAVVSSVAAPTHKAKTFKLTAPRNEIFGKLSREKCKDEVYKTKLNKILDEIEANPYKSDSKGEHIEKLKKELKDCWSRRINDVDRVVYKINEQYRTVEIVRVENHYD
jgi:toxin YoeB